jgi:hypothetical protein
MLPRQKSSTRACQSLATTTMIAKTRKQSTKATCGKENKYNNNNDDDDDNTMMMMMMMLDDYDDRENTTTTTKVNFNKNVMFEQPRFRFVKRCI